MATNSASNSAQRLFIKKILPQNHKRREVFQSQEANSQHLLMCPRNRAIYTTLAITAKNHLFVDRLAAIAVAITDRRLNTAEEACEDLLQSYPYHGELWLLSATVARLKLRAERAEIACRTASAYGAAAMRVNHEFALISDVCPEALRHPLRARWTGPVADQSPGVIDITILADLVWDDAPLGDEEILRFLRKCPNLDRLLATMINDRRFARAHLDWLYSQGGIGI